MDPQPYTGDEQYGDSQYEGGFYDENDAHNGEYAAYPEDLAVCSNCQQNTDYSMHSKQNRKRSQKTYNNNKFERQMLFSIGKPPLKGNQKLRAGAEDYNQDVGGDYNNIQLVKKHDYGAEVCGLYPAQYAQQHARRLMRTEQHLRNVVLAQKKSALKKFGMGEGHDNYYNNTPPLILETKPNIVRIVNNTLVRPLKASNPKYHCNGIQTAANRKGGNNLLSRLQVPVDESQNVATSFGAVPKEDLKKRYNQIRQQNAVKKQISTALGGIGHSTRQIPTKANTNEAQPEPPQDSEETKQLKSFTYNSFEISETKATIKEDEIAVEDQYSSSAAQNSIQDNIYSEAEAPDENVFREDTEAEGASPSRETSDDQIYSKMTPLNEPSAHSHRSHRSKGSARKIKSRRFDLFKLQRSKSSLLSTIDDGIQKCESSSKSGRGKKSQQSQMNGSQDKSLCSCMKLVNPDGISNYVRETRDYHLQKISEELRRIKRLEDLPQKLLQADSN